jgi:hypothetical protein
MAIFLLIKGKIFKGDGIANRGKIKGIAYRIERLFHPKRIQ